MVRFQAGTGALVGASTEPALVLAPRNSAAGRTVSPFNVDGFRADREGREDPVKFVRSWFGRPNSPTLADDRRAVLGRRSSDMVLARPVMQLAIYNENKLAAGLKVRTDRTTGSLYLDPNDSVNNPNHEPRYADNAIYLSDINFWIEGDTNLDATVSDSTGADRPEAKLFAIDRLTGVLRPMEVQP